MTIKKKSKTVKPYIDLDGPDGNSFNLIGKANRLAKELDLDGKAIIEEMMNGDYEHLIKVFDKYFGEYVDLYRS